MRRNFESKTHHDFGGDLELYQDAVGIMSFCMFLLDEFFGIFNHIPYLFARLDEPGVRDICIAEFESTPKHKRDKISLRFCEPGDNPLLVDLMAMNEQGGNMSPQLAFEVSCVQKAPFDDVVAERMHGILSAAMKKARHGSWTWHAASLNHASDLEDYIRFKTLAGVNTQTLWDDYKIALCMNSIRPRPLTLPRKQFFERVYDLRRCIHIHKSRR
jgi:hypothetical protein